MDKTQEYGLFYLDQQHKAGQTVTTGEEPYSVDIVVVHGINGDAYGTWTHQTGKKMWLKDFLPKDLPGARIFTFGYPLKLPSHVQRELRQFARPLPRRCRFIYLGYASAESYPQRRHVMLANFSELQTIPD